MSNKSVFCIATSRLQAERIVDQLKSANLPNHDISAWFADRETSHHFAEERNINVLEGAMSGAGAGGIIGAAVGWIAGIGAMAIPGAGPFIAAGPIVAAFKGAVIGAATGSVAGGLIGIGIPESEARRMKERVRNGNILISFAGRSGEISRAKNIFLYAGAEDICTTGEVSIPGGGGHTDPEPHPQPPEAVLGKDGWVFADRLK